MWIIFIQKLFNRENVDFKFEFLFTERPAGGGVCWNDNAGESVNDAVVANFNSIRIHIIGMKCGT